MLIIVHLDSNEGEGLLKWSLKEFQHIWDL